MALQRSLLGTLSGRAFKTCWFTKAAQKARIGDDELCLAIRQVMLGQADDLGGGVYKKRLNKNMHRSIIVSRAGEFWVYAYLFAKKDRANISEVELKAFRDAATVYSQFSEVEVNVLLRRAEWKEICYDQET